MLDLREKPEGDNDRPEGVFSVSSEPVIKKKSYNIINLNRPKLGQT